MDYLIGEVAHLVVEFENESTRQLVDPTTVRVLIKNSTGHTTLTYGVDAALNKESLGRYCVDQVINVAGPWTIRFEGLGANAAAVEASFVVGRSAI